MGTGGRREGPASATATGTGTVEVDMGRWCDKLMKRNSAKCSFKQLLKQLSHGVSGISDFHMESVSATLPAPLFCVSGCLVHRTGTRLPRPELPPGSCSDYDSLW